MDYQHLPPPTFSSDTPAEVRIWTAPSYSSDALALWEHFNPFRNQIPKIYRCVCQMPNQTSFFVVDFKSQEGPLPRAVRVDFFQGFNSQTFYPGGGRYMNSFHVYFSEFIGDALSGSYYRSRDESFDFYIDPNTKTIRSGTYEGQELTVLGCRTLIPEAGASPNP